MEGVPLPRSGGGWEGAGAPAAPYKHRLAYAPGNRPLVFRAGVPVRRGLGGYPKSLLGTFDDSKVSPRREPYKSNPFIRLAPPKVITGYVTTAPPGRRADYAFAKGPPRRQATTN